MLYMTESQMIKPKAGSYNDQKKPKHSTKETETNLTINHKNNKSQGPSQTGGFFFKAKRGFYPGFEQQKICPERRNISPS